MVRKLKFHEQKLLKKVNLVDWDPKNFKELKYVRKYQITREEYTKWAQQGFEQFVVIN